METPATTTAPIVAAPAAPVESASVQQEAPRPLSPTESLVAAKKQQQALKEAGKAQEPNPVEKEPAPEGEPSASPAGEQKPEKKWDGNFANLEGLPAELHDKAKELQRKMTEITTQNAEALKKAQAFEQYVQSPEYQAFQQWAQAQNAKPVVEIAGVKVDAEIAEAALTDPNALVTLVDKIAEMKVAEKERKANEQQVLAEKETYVASFANKTPDFWETYDTFGDIMKAQMSRGASIEDAYGHVKSLQQSIAAKEREAFQARVQEKKAGVTLTPSLKQDSEIVWVDSPRESYEVARKLAEQGIRKEVRVKPRARR